MKIAIIGAGSIIFCKTLVLDIMQIPGVGHIDFSLMAPSTRRTPAVRDFIQRVIDDNRLDASVSITTDRREALTGADFVICTLQIGGLRAYEADMEIPMKYGVDQCIGDTLGPGGIFRSLRTIPVMRSVAEDMRECCPGALMLNYVNPMATVCWSLADTGIRYVGLCHGVQTTLDLIAGYTDVPKNEIVYESAGINHMAWFLRLEHNGKDLYPILRERFEKPEYYANERVRGEIFRQFGYFMTESSGHLSEYLPYFRKNKKSMDIYCSEPDFGGESGANLKWTRRVDAKYAHTNPLAGESSVLPQRSVEYCSYIIEALTTGKIFRFNGNMRNNGMITNLPYDCCAEMTIFADKSGLHQTFVGALPSQCAALNMTNINVQRLTVEAALTGNPDTVVQALALDPITSSALNPGEIRRMAGEMLEAEKEWLPQFTTKLTPKDDIVIPKGTVRARVPVDPALAINARFAEL